MRMPLKNAFLRRKNKIKKATIFKCIRSLLFTVAGRNF